MAVGGAAVDERGDIEVLRVVESLEGCVEQELLLREAGFGHVHDDLSLDSSDGVPGRLLKVEKELEGGGDGSMTESVNRVNRDFALTGRMIMDEEHA